MKTFFAPLMVCLIGLQLHGQIIFKDYQLDTFSHRYKCVLDGDSLGFIQTRYFQGANGFVFDIQTSYPRMFLHSTFYFSEDGSRLDSAFMVGKLGDNPSSAELFMNDNRADGFSNFMISKGSEPYYYSLELTPEAMEQQLAFWFLPYHRDFGKELRFEKKIINFYQGILYANLSKFLRKEYLDLDGKVINTHLFHCAYGRTDYSVWVDKTSKRILQFNWHPDSWQMRWVK